MSPFECDVISKNNGFDCPSCAIQHKTVISANPMIR